MARRCAYAAAGVAVAVPVVGAVVRPGYSSSAQYISELGERGADGGAVVSLFGFVPVGVLTVWFGILAVPELWRRDPVRRTRVLAGAVALVVTAVATGYVLSGFARCEPGCPSTGDGQQLVHNVSGYIEYGLAPIGLVAAAVAARRLPGWRTVAVWSAAAAAAFVALAPLVEREQWRASRGLLQRILELSLFVWIVLVGRGVERASRARS